ncbi:MAG: hypothetical protein KJO19_00555, partial [Woeseia sp.]|nr:hypothetical protein [Woeseia sp.]
MPIGLRHAPRGEIGKTATLIGLFLYSICNASAVANPLFTADDVLEVTLTGPLSSLIEDPEHKVEAPFILTADGVEHSIAVRTRGNSRLQVCEFPPLRLNFVREATRGSVFEGQNKLKLVTHCRNYDRGEQDMLEEFLAYRLFNVLTDASFRVRMMRIRYVDTDGGLDDDASFRYGFALEPEDQLAARLGGAPAEISGVPKRRHDLEQASLLYLFQYMIGNTDWGFVKADYDDTCCHNVELFEIDGVIHTIPYDFDLTGLVNARYARPDPLLRIKTVRQRLYRGLCT